jgi:hypothetical protein
MTDELKDLESELDEALSGDEITDEDFTEIEGAAEPEADGERKSTTNQNRNRVLSLRIAIQKLRRPPKSLSSGKPISAQRSKSWRRSGPN